MNAFTTQLIATLDADTNGALAALATALVADKTARAALEAALLAGEVPPADPVGDLVALIVKDDGAGNVARKALEHQLFQDGDFLKTFFAEGTAQDQATALQAVADRAMPGLVAKLLAAGTLGPFVLEVARANTADVKGLIDGLRDNPTTGPIVIAEVMADGNPARPKIEAAFRTDPPLTELIGVLAAAASLDAFVKAVLNNPDAKNAIIRSLTGTPTDLIANLIDNHQADLLNALLADTSHARDALLAQVAATPKVQGLASAAIRDGARAAKAAAVAAHDPDPAQKGRDFIDPTVQVLGLSDEFLDGFVRLTGIGNAALIHVVSRLVAAANAPATFTAALLADATLESDFLDIVGDIAANVPTMKAAIKLKVS